MKAASEMIPTRHSLLSRLKDWNDQESWKQFFDTYWRLIYSAAIRAGLSDTEAQDVVQETVISVSKGLAKSQYSAEKGSFKGWLLRMTRWRIADQLRKRQCAGATAPVESNENTGTRTVERIADPAGLVLDSVWDEEWERNLMETALERVKGQVDPKQYQVFDLYVLKGWPVARVTRALQVSAAKVYVTKHRIGGLIKKEVNRLRRQPI
ncbi:MAG TPA: sigma-70 family RNA polymerase sigma factor [Clostridia bacterium]|nr:sigma-70 family RNA polymerase sigma factor [Clostridia bacterium]